MLRLARGTRLQHVIVNSFPPSGTRPTPIWRLEELLPDAAERGHMRRVMANNGVGEVDFLRWRNACVAPTIRHAFDYIRGAEIATPLWVTSHMLRRKIHNAGDASLAAHLALLAVPSNRPLAPAHEAPLLLALEHVARYDLVYALPAIVTRMLALPVKNHSRVVALLSRSDLTHSPLMTETLRALVEDIMALPLVLSRQIWLQVWQRWGDTRALGTVFSDWLRTRMRAQGIIPITTYQSPPERTFTPGATYLKDNKPPTSHASLASLTAAANSKNISARVLLAIAHSLIHGFYPRPPDSHIQPDAEFIATLIDGLVERKAYNRAQAVWKDAERRVSLSNGTSLPANTASESEDHYLTLTPSLFNAGLSSYAVAGNLNRALEMLDKYASIYPESDQLFPNPYPITKHRTTRSRPYVTSSALNAILPYLPPHAQHLVFVHSAQRWGIEPDSLALETVMQSALQSAKLHREDNHNGPANVSFRDNLREFREGFRDILTRARSGSSNLLTSQSNSSDEWAWYNEQLDLALDPAHRTRDRALIRQNAIDLFRSVVLGNWPFIAGREIDILFAMESKDQNTDNILAPRNMALFVPGPLRRKVAPRPTHSPKPKAPSTLSLVPLHPSPTPRFPNAHPTVRAWSAYLALLPVESLPEALGWMRSADESMRRPNSTATGIHTFRPEKSALIDALLRWEAVVLAQETLVERVLHARERGRAGNDEEIGPEGALRAWLVEWLGSEHVPSREAVARARLDRYDFDSAV